MTWYRKSDEQQDFPFMDDSTKMESPERFHSTQDLESLQALCEETSGYLGIESLLSKYGYDFEMLVFPDNRFIFIVRLDGESYAIPDSQSPWPAEAEPWIYSLSDMELYDLYPDSEGNFWEDLPSDFVMYHGTYEENLDDIISQGLEPRDMSRGVDNRGTGPGVFMSDSAEQALSHYPVVIEVALGAMKQDGYTPAVGREDPIITSNLRDALANRLGLTEFHSDLEDGLFEDTMICRETVPPKYLKIIREETQ
jgi:hypothetical protein